jgi:hypothetical protein
MGVFGQDSQALLDPTWSPLYGSIAPLVVMSFLMEYIVVLIYLFVGFAIPPIQKIKMGSTSDEGSKV